MRSNPKHPALHLAIDGEGVSPRDVSIRQLAEFLTATAATLDAIATQRGLPPPKPSLVAVRTGSAAYELTSPAPTWETIVVDFYNAAKTRAEGRPTAVRRGFERMFVLSSRIGSVRIGASHTTDGVHRKGIHLAVPLQDGADRVAFGTTVHGRIVGVQEGERGFAVKLALAEGGRQEFDANETMAIAAAKRFGAKVKAEATGWWDGQATSGYTLVSIESWDDTDLLQALFDVREELEREGVEVDADGWIAELDAE